MTPYALVGNVLAPELLARAAVVVEDGRILDVIRSFPDGDLLMPFEQALHDRHRHPENLRDFLPQHATIKP
jgi:hypothetical protein